MGGTTTKKTVAVSDFMADRTGLPGAGLGWLEDLRRDGAEQFELMGLPDKSWEDWKYTSLAPLAEGGFGTRYVDPIDPCEEMASARSLVDRSERVDQILFVNGHHVPAPDLVGPLPEGVRLTSIRSALEEDPELVRGHLARCVGNDRHPMAALNMALWQDGLFLLVPEGVVLERPVNVIFFDGGARTDLNGVHVRNVVVAGERSSAVVYESYGHLAEGRHLTNVVTEIEVAAAARVEHYRVQNENPESWHVALMSARQDRESHFSSRVLSVGARVGRNEIEVLLAGEGAHCTLDGLYLGRDERHLDNQTHIDHAVAHTSSREHYRGILDGRSTGAFTGRVLVRPDAQQIDADQHNKNLLLSDKATASSRPQLEIYADDVKCSHGATTGQLDALALFYLRSRGLPEDRAKAVLTSAFAREILQGIENVIIRDHLEKYLFEYLGAGAEAPETT